MVEHLRLVTQKENYIKREEIKMKTQNKWICAAIPGLLLHCSIGTVYCWSYVSGAVSSAIGYDIKTVNWAFSIAILFLGMSAAFLGNFVEKDIHKASLIATICFSVGMAGTGFFVWLGISENSCCYISSLYSFACCLYASRKAYREGIGSKESKRKQINRIVFVKPVV